MDIFRFIYYMKLTTYIVWNVTFFVISNPNTSKVMDSRFRTKYQYWQLCVNPLSTEVHLKMRIATMIMKKIYNYHQCFLLYCVRFHLNRFKLFLYIHNSFFLFSDFLHTLCAFVCISLLLSFLFQRMLIRKNF